MTNPPSDIDKHYPCAICKGQFTFEEMAASGQQVPRYCKECKRAKNRSYYAKNREYWLSVQRKYHKTPEGKRSMSRSNATQRSKFPEKTKARIAVRAAILKGTLVKQPCETCSETKVDAHHEDYSKPLDVQWLCRRHHFDAHKFTLESRGVL